MKKHLIIGAVVAAVAIGAVQFVPQRTVVTPPQQANRCDPTLWAHVYAGDPRRFHKPQDRLQVIKDCLTVTGTLISAKAEKDGDWHLQLDVDDKTLLNDKNKSGQKGYLVLEPVCSNVVLQRDTLDEHACDNFTQNIFKKAMLGKRVQAVGVYVIDQEHLWAEIHPLSSLTLLP